MSRSALLLPLLALLFITATSAGAACTAGHPNANLVEATPDSAFTDNGDGTVTHALTGLVWQRCALGQTWAGGTCTGTPAQMTWVQATTASVADNTGGASDWRLPNKKELESITEYCGYQPSINGNQFPATPYDHGFWTSTSFYTGVTAWVVDFSTGVNYARDKTDTGSSDMQYVRLVRGGQNYDAWPPDATPDAFSFTDRTDVARSAQIISAPVQITGINLATSWSATGGEVCVRNSADCSGCTWSASGTVTNGQYLCARHTSSASHATLTDTTVTVGGVSDVFSSTTLTAAADASATPIPGLSGWGAALLSALLGGTALRRRKQGGASRGFY